MIKLRKKYFILSFLSFFIVTSLWAITNPKEISGFKILSGSEGKLDHCPPQGSTLSRMENQSITKKGVSGSDWYIHENQGKETRWLIKDDEYEKEDKNNKSKKITVNAPVIHTSAELVSGELLRQLGFTTPDMCLLEWNDPVKGMIRLVAIKYFDQEEDKKFTSPPTLASHFDNQTMKKINTSLPDSFEFRKIPFAMFLINDYDHYANTGNILIHPETKKFKLIDFSGSLNGSAVGGEKIFKGKPIEQHFTSLNNYFKKDYEKNIQKPHRFLGNIEEHPWGKEFSAEELSQLIVEYKSLNDDQLGQLVNRGMYEDETMKNKIIQTLKERRNALVSYFEEKLTSLPQKPEKESSSPKLSSPSLQYLENTWKELSKKIPAITPPIVCDFNTCPQGVVEAEKMMSNWLQISASLEQKNLLSDYDPFCKLVDYAKICQKNDLIEKTKELLSSANAPRCRPELKIDLKRANLLQQLEEKRNELKLAITLRMEENSSPEEAIKQIDQLLNLEKDMLNQLRKQRKKEKKLILAQFFDDSKMQEIGDDIKLINNHYQALVNKGNALPHKILLNLEETEKKAIVRQKERDEVRSFIHDQLNKLKTLHPSLNASVEKLSERNKKKDPSPLNTENIDVDFLEDATEIKKRIY